jgi:hypothetical protein
MTIYNGRCPCWFLCEGLEDIWNRNLVGFVFLILRLLNRGRSVAGSSTVRSNMSVYTRVASVKL